MQLRNEHKVAQIGVFVALAMIFSYVECLIPFHFGIPGVKLGIANLVIVTGLYRFSAKEVFLIAVIRVVMMGMLFGNGVSLVYSLVGGIFSFFAMVIWKKTSMFSVVGVSIVGGVVHNIGQLLTASVILHNHKVMVYLPVLMVAGMVTGALNGMLSKHILERLRMS